MNKKQSLWQWFCGIGLCLIFLFPPWIYEEMRSEAYYRFLATGQNAEDVHDPIGESYSVSWSFYASPPEDGYPPHYCTMILTAEIFFVFLLYRLGKHLLRSRQIEATGAYDNLIKSSRFR